MAYSRVRIPKFYIDSVLLARQWGELTEINSRGKFHLNPAKVTEFTMPNSGRHHTTIDFNGYHWQKSSDHLFLLGHENSSNGISIRSKVELLENGTLIGEDTHMSLVSDTHDGWSKYSVDESENLGERFTITFEGSSSQTFLIGDFSLGWSYEMPHSPDVELTNIHFNESLKVKRTLGGHDVTNTNYNQQPKWIKAAWQRGFTNTFDNYNVGQVGRRAWNLSFSLLSDTDIFQNFYTNDLASEQVLDYGIFRGIGEGNVKIKDDFISKVFHGTNGFQLPFIFQPDKEVEEYAICRINSKSLQSNQTSFNTYDISLEITETF